MEPIFKSIFLENVKPEKYLFYKITQKAYLLGLGGHFLLGFLFLWLKVHEMMWFNFIFSSPVFLFSLLVNRRGYHGLAFSAGFSEILFHQIAAVYYIGWESGMQFWLIYLAGLTFFNTYWKRSVRISLISIISATLILLYLYIRNHQVYLLSEPVYDFFYLNSIITALLSLALLIHYYVQIAEKAEQNLKSANLQLSEKNAQIEQALSERNQALKQLQQELAEAADYVRTILPLPLAGGNVSTDWRFIPCSSVGGDAFGYHWLDDDHFVIYLIDVSGHGVGAALLSVSVMNALRSQSLPNTDFKDPEDVLASLNEAFPGEENNDMFFTIWYGVYQKSSRQLAYAGGGHPPALIFENSRTDDSKATLLRSANNAIGAMPDVTYKKTIHSLGKQNTLYIFSDGVYEVEKSDGSMWQFNEFTDFMATMKSGSQSRLDRLYRHADKINIQDNFDDDFTILEVAIS